MAASPRMGTERCMDRATKMSIQLKPEERSGRRKGETNVGEPTLIPTSGLQIYHDEMTCAVAAVELEQGCDIVDDGRKPWHRRPDNEYKHQLKDTTSCAIARVPRTTSADCGNSTETTAILLPQCTLSGSCIGRTSISYDNVRPFAWLA